MDLATTELTESEAYAAEEAAMVEAFGAADPTAASLAPSEEPQSGDDPPKDQPTAAAPAAPAASSDGEVDDALASLPEPYRQALGRVPALESKLSSAEGRLRAQAEEIKALRQQRAAPADAPASPTPSPRDAAISRVREVLPEVADAIELASPAPAPAPAPAPVPAAPAPAVSHEAAMKARFPELSSVHPDWVAQVNDPAWDAWLARQPYEKQVELQGTPSQVVVADAVARFKARQQPAPVPAAAPAASAAATLEAQRQARLRAAAVPEGASARPASVSTEPEDEVMAAFLEGYSSPGM